jgi:hypothetical protein
MAILIVPGPLGGYRARPPTFRHFLGDALLSLGLPYGPQARERLAQAYPGLFGRAYHLTLRGYVRWLGLRAEPDSLEAFAQYMEARYRRWLGADLAA